MAADNSAVNKGMKLAKNAAAVGLDADGGDA